MNEVDLDIGPGEWAALVGANGSGKSTLAKICNALLTPTRGVCFVMGADAAAPGSPEEIRKNVALVFQNPDDQIVASIVEEDVAFGPENLRLSRDEIRARVDRALELTGLSRYRLRGSFSLSGGQKQRLALAGALALDPAVLLLDESTSMLDPEGRESFLRRLGDLNACGMTLLQVTHRMDEVVHARRVVVMERGRVVWDGASSDFFGGEYLRWNFAEPQELILYRELLARGFIRQGTVPTVLGMLGSLCL
ncbi:MAG: ATP-binding cassette domain-containing protein [Synergistaceae bacterium]|nr:ATP-binding cassette domain-containing protein [Synergistaceae bacterium]